MSNQPATAKIRYADVEVVTVQVDPAKEEITLLLPREQSAPSAEIVPFPLRATPSWQAIAAEYARRPMKGRYNKADYAEKVIGNNSERLQRLGVAPERIDAEIASLRRLFNSLGHVDKARA